jgi:hypothetical protein
MRNIHPELIEKMSSTLSPLEKWWKAIQTTITAETVKGRVDQLWGAQVSAYLEGVLEFLGTMHDRNPTVYNENELSRLAANSIVPPFKTILEMCPHKYSYHMLTHMDEYTTLCVKFAELIFSTRQSTTDLLMANPAMQAVTTHNIALYSFLSWASAGHKTYTMTSDLTYSLRNTNLHKYQCDWLRAPVPACYIEFPKGEFTFTTYSDELTPSDTGFITLPVEGAYILEDTTPLGMRLWRVVVICQYQDKPSEQVHINHYYIPLRDGTAVDTCLEEASSMMKGEQICEVTLPGNEIGKVGHISGRTDKWDDVIVKSSEEIFKFLMNCVIYITRDDADLIFADTSPEYSRMKARMLAAKGKKREELKKRLKGLDNNVRVVVGKNYTINRWDEKHASHGDGSRHITVRTLVSGHWRKQPCGTGHLDRKTIWIEPHWRGPEEAPLTAKRAVVK